eukprot:2783975-Rhodomonas_salina.1
MRAGGLLLDPSTCSDGLQNQDETGVDCGGTVCGPGSCETCSDGEQNQGETGVACGGPCEASRLRGWPCGWRGRV